MAEKQVDVITLDIIKDSLLARRGGDLHRHRPHLQEPHHL